MPSRTRIIPRLPPASGRGRGRGRGQLRVVLSPKAQALFAVIGVTVDAAGAPLGNMVVHLIRAGTPALVSSGVSDGSGNYSLPTPDNAGNFFVVSFHSDGSLAGITRPVLVAVRV